MNKARFTLSKKIILKQYNKVKESADIVSYSSKTNQLVTPILERETSSLFSVHFINELKHINDLSRVIFLAQAWDEEFIGKVIQKGITKFVVDNESDLEILLQYLEKNDANITLLLRLKLKENTIRTERFFVFGMDSKTINKRISELKNNKKIKELGIHFHRKTQNMSEWNIQQELEQILTPETLRSISTLNIGGGLPSEYANTNVDVLQGIFTKLAELKTWLNKQNIKLIIEPGRFIAAPSGKLVAQIVGIDKNNITVNASIYNSDLDAVIVPVKLKIEQEVPKEEGKAYVIKGITPCSVDLFRYRAYLKNPQVGGTITFLNAGAYNFTTDFCDLDKLETDMVD